ncbi:MAG: GAF domain-containing sensor histidine kinase [Ardenticatenaceae bacterium]|nr:GAF domain-containing sensor histidine kinase [Ardenticatenaceae bacterium]
MLNQIRSIPDYFRTQSPLIEDEFRQVVLGYIWPGSLILFALHLIVTVSYPFLLPQSQWPFVSAVSGGTGVVVLLGILWQWRTALEKQHVYQFSFVFLALPIILDNLGTYYFTRNPLIIFQVFIAALLLGYFLLNSRWMALIQAINLLGSAILVFWLDGFPILVEYSVIGSGAILGIFFLHAAHRQSLIRQIEARQKEREARLIADGLQEIGSNLTTSLTRQQVIQAIFDNLVKVLACDRISILIHEGDELVVLASRGFPDSLMQRGGTRIFIGDADPNDIFPTLRRTQRAVVIPDVRQRPEWVYLDGMSPAIVYLGLPLLAQNEVIGILSLVRTTEMQFSPEEIRSAELFASQAAIALLNADLYEQVTAFNQTLEQQVQERTADLEKAYQQLTRLDQAKSDFITIMSHEIRTPLTVLRGYIQMLHRDAGLQADDQLSHYIRGIDSGSLRLQELVENLLIMVRLDNNTMDVYWTELIVGDLLSLVSSNLESVFSARNLQFSLGDELFNLPPIVGDFDLLEIVMNQLLLNAVKYTPDGGKIEVGGRMSRRPDQDGVIRPGVEICVKDSGIGIAPENQELIFTKFYQAGRVDLHSSSKTKFKGGGAGLGLSIANGLITLHQGVIWAESEGLDEEKFPGSRFFVWLPLERQETTDHRPQTTKVQI